MICTPDVSCRGLPPFNIWDSNGNIFGVDVDLVDILAKKFKFTFIVFVKPFMGRPVEGSSEEWLGVVGSVSSVHVHM